MTFRFVKGVEAAEWHIPGHDRHELVRALLQRSAKMSQSNQQGATALHVAARNGQCDTVAAANSFTKEVQYI